MRRITAIATLAALTAFTTLLSGCQGFGNAGDDFETAAVPAGMRLQVSLDSRLDSGENQTGDTFTMSVTEPVIVDGRELIPRGATVHGVLIDVESAKRPQKGGKLVLQAQEITLRGTTVPIQAKITALKGEGSLKEDLKEIGIGAGVGAAVGAIIKGGKGALAGLAIGGVGTFLSTKGEQVELPAETPLVVELTEEVSVPVLPS